MNTYVYAPKDDPYQRADWRKLYPESEVRRFQELIGRAGRNGVSFVYSISPGLDVTYSGDADRQALAAKLDQLRGLGIHTFMLSLDDVPEKLTPADSARYGTNYALAQVDLANWLYQNERAKDDRFAMWVTQSHYWGLKPDEYLNTFGTKLDPAVPLIWTGPDVISEQLTVRETDTMTSIMRRKPIIWDNYPVNDYTYVQKKKPRLILGPIRGRAPDLAGHVAGFLLNPMIQAEASQLPLYTAAAYLADPDGYDPDAAWRDASSHLAKDPAVLLEFASYAVLSVLYDTDAPDLAKAINDYNSGVGNAAAALRQRFASMESLPDRLKAALSDGFYQEVAPWAEALGRIGETGSLALDMDAAVARNDLAAVKASLPSVRGGLAGLQSQQAQAYIGSNMVETFVAKVTARAEPLAR